MRTIKAVYDGVQFKPEQPITVKESYNVLITFLDPVNNSTKKRPRFLREPDPSKSHALGMWNGEVKIPDDFDEPLDEMKEYMY